MCWVCKMSQHQCFRSRVEVVHKHHCYKIQKQTVWISVLSTPISGVPFYWQCYIVTEHRSLFQLESLCDTETYSWSYMSTYFCIVRHIYTDHVPSTRKVPDPVRVGRRVHNVLPGGLFPLPSLPGWFWSSMVRMGGRGGSWSVLPRNVNGRLYCNGIWRSTYNDLQKLSLWTLHVVVLCLSAEFFSTGLSTLCTCCSKVENLQNIFGYFAD